MEQYQRNSESEMTRVLINESYQEQVEIGLYEKKLAKLKERHDKRRRHRELSARTSRNYNTKIVDKIERVMTEMREEYNNYRGGELNDYGSDTNIEWEKRISWNMFKSEYGHQDNNRILNKNEYFRWKAFHEVDEIEAKKGLEELGDIEVIIHDREGVYSDLATVYHENRQDFWKEQDSNLKEMLRVRHNLPKDKKILLWDN